MKGPKAWLLLSNRLGDNNQLFALAEALGFPFEVKDLSFNRLKYVPFFGRLGLAIVAAKSRSLIRPPWPDIVLATGYPAVPVARYIRRASGSRPRLVHIGNPRCRIDDFDLQITTPQYARRASSRTLQLPFPIGNPAQTVETFEREQRWLAEFSRPFRLIAVGGPARHWQLDHDKLLEAIAALRKKKPAMTVVIATSPRTPRATRRLLGSLGVSEDGVVLDPPMRFPVLLANAAEIFVTADSVSMVSEAMLTGKPVGMIAIKRSLRGRLAHWLWTRSLAPAPVPDLPNFWKLLTDDALIGTVDLPVSSQVCDTVGRAVAAVRSLMAPGDVIDEREH